MAPDQTRFEHERLGLARAHHPVHGRDLLEQVLDLLALVAVEVRADPRAEVRGLADVQDGSVPSAEQVHTGGVREMVGEPDLAEVRASTSAARLPEIAERADPEPLAEPHEPLEDLGGGARVVERAMRGAHRRPEVLGEGPQLHVGHVGPHDPPSEPGRAHGGIGQRRVAEVEERGVQEPDVVARVVRNEDRAAEELEQARHHRSDRRSVGDVAIGDARQVRDEARDRRPRIDQRVERSDPLAVSQLDRPDLGDGPVGRRPPGRLEIEDAEVDLVERHGVLERGLGRLEPSEHQRRLPFTVGPRGGGREGIERTFDRSSRPERRPGRGRKRCGVPRRRAG